MSVFMSASTRNVLRLYGKLARCRNLYQVSVVSPLVNTTPLFVIGLTALFLRGEEKINRFVVIGVVLLVAGIAAIMGR